jgi:acyl-CoA thioesterase-1
MLRAAVVPLVVATACIGGEKGERAAASGSGPAAVESERPTLETGERSSPLRTEGDAEDPVVVVFLGTSLTAGLGLEREEDRYPELIGSMADSAGISIEVVNAGVSGDTSAGGLRRLDWILRDPLDILVVELGANDGLRGLDTTQLEANLREIARRARERVPNLTIVFVGMEAPPNLGPRYTERFRSVYPRVAREEGASLLPFLLEGVAGNPDLNQADGMHPNREGHRIIARDVLWPGLEPILREAASAKQSVSRP